jgi:hypothetical protein
VLGPGGGTRLALTAFATGTNCQINPCFGNYDHIVACRRAQTAYPPRGPVRANPHPAARVVLHDSGASASATLSWREDGARRLGYASLITLS